jgi:anthranilate phosphoribosyltransferase
MIKEVIIKAINGEDLATDEMEKTMRLILDGKVASSQIGALMTALRMKGETADEITGAARALQQRAVKLNLDNGLLSLGRDDIHVEKETVLATMGSGSGATSTFNISTATMFVASAGGVKMARHGNRPASSYFGAGDVLENLGVNLDISNSDMEKCINELGLGFIFKPLLSGPMKHVGKFREEMGIRTIFNLIAPLINPAGAGAYVLGVYQPALTEKMAHVLAQLGAETALVVHGEKTYDEISLCGATTVSRLLDGKVETRDIEPERYGFKRVALEEISGGDARANARIVADILDGGKGPKRDITLLNAAAAFLTAGLDKDFKSGIERAAAAIDSGKARSKLDALVAFTGQCRPFVRKEL